MPVCSARQPTPDKDLVVATLWAKRGRGGSITSSSGQEYWLRDGPSSDKVRRGRGRPEDRRPTPHASGAPLVTPSIRLTDIRRCRSVVGSTLKLARKVATRSRRARSS